MFRSALLKLTAYYLIIIVAISLFFSLIIYRIAYNEFDRGYRRPPITIHFDDNPLMTFEEFREARITESQLALRHNLVTFNILTFIIGGLASYLLAQRTLRPIEQAMEAQSRFTADASHELRTPLAAMQSQIEVTLRDPKLLVKEARETLESNLEEVAKLNNLSSSLLKLARNNGQDIKLYKVDIGKVLDISIKQVNVSAKAKNIKIKNNIGEKYVLGDKISLTELGVILLDNAIKYSPENTEIELSSVGHSKTLELIFKDQGIGIDPKDLPHIFDRFYRADQSRTKGSQSGYGLGLSIAHKIVESHKGSMDVQSSLGKGSTFSVKLLSYEGHILHSKK